MWLRPSLSELAGDVHVSDLSESLRPQELFADILR